LLAAVVVIFVVLICIRCIQSPGNWPIILVLAPIAAVIVFLAVQLGSFLVADRPFRLAEAQRTRVQSTAVLKSSKLRSRWNPLIVVLVNSGVIAIFAGAATLPLGSLFASAVYSGFFLIAAVLVISVSVFAKYEWRKSPDWASRAAVVVMALLVLLAELALAVSVTLAVEEPRGWFIAAPLIGVLVIASLLVWTKPPQRWRWVRNISVYGAAARVSARTACRRYVKATREVIRLSEPASPPDPIGRVARLLAFLRHE
jgi:hypothetical protein